jgi:hypothetical protein
MNKHFTTSIHNDIHNDNVKSAMQCMTSLLPTRPQGNVLKEGSRAATTLLYLNVRCCTGTYCTNSATVFSYAHENENARLQCKKYIET